MRHPVAWYRAALAFFAIGIVLDCVFGRLMDFVVLVLTGQIIRHNVGEFATTILLLVLSFLPLHLTVLWLRRGRDAETADRLSYPMGLKSVLITGFSALQPEGSVPTDSPGTQFPARVTDPVPTAIVAAVVVGVGLAAGGLDSSHAVRDALSITFIGTLAGAATYCLQRARAYTSVNGTRLGVFPTPFSLRSRDYAGVGKRWFVAASFLSGLWGLLAALFVFSRI